jgi:hypothetical protein
MDEEEDTLLIFSLDESEIVSPPTAESSPNRLLGERSFSRSLEAIRRIPLRGERRLLSTVSKPAISDKNTLHTHC